MNAFCLALLLLTADANSPFTAPKSAEADYGHGLTPALAMDGWISLFDGRTTFGWEGATVSDGALRGGRTKHEFPDAELRVDVIVAGQIAFGNRRFDVGRGLWAKTVTDIRRANVSLDDGVVVRTLLLRPIGLEPLFNGRDLSGWKAIRHPRLSDERQTTWKVENRAIHARGGPGALEYQQHYGDLLLQAEICTRATLVNGGLFFRSVPHDFLNGYEVQIFNACYDQDADRPARYSTGAIDDRQLARRLVSRDAEPFLMTVLAIGPRISTWINGEQMTDWMDDRRPHGNPREGRRNEPGTIQLQAHDADSDLEFRAIRIRSLE